jgi:5-methylcytosine-specific restriction endonuclease McrA
MFEHQKTMFESRPRMTWRDKYNAVIASKRWRGLRDRRFHDTGGKCERCGWEQSRWHKGRGLELHHKTYERLGEELPGDLELLCQRCHAAADIERAREGERRSSNALWDARFYGWARSVYGDDWYDGDVEDAYDRFCDWLDGLD